MFGGDPDIRIGTSSWSSKDWVGPFYPRGTRPEQFIAYYSGIYDTVEIDATFYRLPTKANVRAWRERTPDGFRFAVKTPRSITHEKILVDADDEMRLFLDTINDLGDRLGPVLLQFPYFNKGKFSKREQFFERLDAFLEGLPGEFDYVVELRNRAWIRRELVELCNARNVALAWVEQAWMPSAGEWPKLAAGLESRFAYIRWLGDHQAIEQLTKKWDQPVIDKSDVLRAWIEVLRELRRRQIAIYGYFNNHFAGHAPSSVELFRELFIEDR